MVDIPVTHHLAVGDFLTLPPCWSWSCRTQQTFPNDMIRWFSCLVLEFYSTMKWLHSIHHKKAASVYVYQRGRRYSSTWNITLMMVCIQYIWYMYTLNVFCFTAHMHCVLSTSYSPHMALPVMAQPKCQSASSSSSSSPSSMVQNTSTSYTTPKTKLVITLIKIKKILDWCCVGVQVISPEVSGT